MSDIRRPAVGAARSTPSEWVSSSCGVLALRRLGQLQARLSARTLASGVKRSVFRVAHRNKILGPIVCLISVDVMGILVWLQRATKFLFKHNPMFENVAVESMFSPRGRMVRLVDVHVPADFSTPREVPVIRAKLLDAVTLHERPWVALEQSLSNIRLGGHLGVLSAPAFAETGWGLTWFRDVPLRRWSPARRVTWQEPRRVVARAFGWWQERLAASTFTNLRTLSVDHAFDSTMEV